MREYNPKYWDRKGFHQELHDAMTDALVPMEGKASSRAGEMIRLVDNIYYERMNNGGSFNYGQRKEQGQKLKRMVSFTTPRGDNDSWDLMVDRVVLAAFRELANDLPSLKLVNDQLKKARKIDKKPKA